MATTLVTAQPIQIALDSAIQHLRSDAGYEIIANGERWQFLLEAVLKGSGMNAKDVAEAMHQIERVRT